MDYKHVTYGISIKVPQGIKRYGPVNRNGKIFYRDYGRELKNKKGVSFTELLSQKVEDAHRRLLMEI